MPKIILPNLLDNLESLKAQEEKIRVDSCLLINSQESLGEHIKFIHASMDMLMWMHNRTKELKTDKLVTIAGLRVRLFNAIACALKLLLTGYYQGAIAFIRDILEISFLLDYFILDETSIERWAKNPDDQEFKAVNIRKALDKRDGLSEQKRHHRYKLLSMYGTHASFDGNRLLSNNDLLTIGPFFSQKFLENILFELAVLQPHPTLSCMKFEANLSIQDFQAKKEFFTSLRSWWRININKNLGDEELCEINNYFELLGLN